MRPAIAGLALVLLAVVFTSAARPARAEDGSEEQQRCVSSCLYHAKGSSDPAYERCVAKYCAKLGEDEDGEAAPKSKKK